MHIKEIDVDSVAGDPAIADSATVTYLNRLATESIATDSTAAESTAADSEVAEPVASAASESTDAELKAVELEAVEAMRLFKLVHDVAFASPYSNAVMLRSYAPLKCGYCCEFFVTIDSWISCLCNSPSL